MCLKKLPTLFSIRILTKQPAIVRTSLKMISKYQKLTNSSFSTHVNG